MSKVRLQKLLARAGAGSRRACEQLIVDGRVTVDGRVATLGESVEFGADEVCLDGVLVRASQRIVLALNKPCGYMSAMKDDRGKPCVSELLPLDVWPALFHVGRLDIDTSGLLLFTTDGELGYALTHPSHQVEKTYHARVRGHLSEAELKALREGVLLDDGITAPAHASVLESGGGESVVELRIHEGRNRQVRRMLEVVGHPVITLCRTAIGAFSLGTLAEGAWRELSEPEIEALFA